MITLVLYIAALVCFILGAVGVGGRVNLVAAGLACAMAGFIAARFV